MTALMDLAESKYTEGQALYRAFMNEGKDMGSLDLAIQLQRESNSLTPNNHPERGPRSSQLSGYLSLRVDGSSDFESRSKYTLEAVQAARAGVAYTSRNDPRRVGYQMNLSERLQTRYTIMQALKDLEDAIQAAQEGADCALTAPSKNLCLSALRHALSRRFIRLGHTPDIDRAVSVGKQILASDPDNIDFLIDSSTDLRTRFDGIGMVEGLGVMDDLHEALRIQRDALRITEKRATPNDKDWRPWLLGNMSGVLKLRFDKLTDLADLDEAIRKSIEAFHLFPDGHYCRPQRLNFLGIFFRARYDFERLPHDLTESIEYFELVSRTPNATPFIRILAQKGAAENFVERKEWSSAAQCLKTALEELPNLALRSVTRSDQLDWLKTLPEIGPLAASVFLLAGESPCDALNALESGRGFTSSLVIDSRKDLSQLQTSKPELGPSISEYQALRETLRLVENPGNAQNPTEDDLLRKARNLKSLELLEEKITQISGDKLLNKPLKYEEILNQARYGPLVSFNVESITSQAFVVTSAGIQVIPLPELTTASVASNVELWMSKGQSKGRNMELEDDGGFTEPNIEKYLDRDNDNILRESLQWLWDAGVKPVLEASQLLQQTSCNSGRLPRIWWIGGGLMALTPLHAAGQHNEGSTSNTLSHAVSSYSSTLRTLQYARIKDWKPLMPCDKLMIVAAPDPPGWRSLDVKKEVKGIRQRVGSKVLVSSQEFVTKAEVLQALPDSAIAHFACHGALDSRDPVNSALILASGDKLAISDLSESNFSSARLAYLSACSTAESNTKGSIAESIHLANSFQLVGFCHVVGTLWEANDDAAIQVTETFYDHLVNGGIQTHDTVAYALHEAMISSKEYWKGMGGFRNWAPFIHVGP